MRVFLPEGKQNKFINKILSRISVNEAARLCNLSERTIRDWRRERFSVDLKALRKLCRKTGIEFPSHVKLKDDYWYTSNGSFAGGIAVYKKYGRIGGDPEYRKKKWYEWWEREGRFKKHSIVNVCRPIKKPRKSKYLAEFVGIMIGDGGITKRQVRVWLNSKTDKLYIIFVKNFIKGLFNTKPSINPKRNQSVVEILVSRTRLVEFCESIGLKIGNKLKQSVDIPNWIKRDKQYRVACVRGLVDTDGCVFTHSYRVNGKLYKYKKLAFTSYSKPLRQSVFNILKGIGLNPRLAGDRDIRLDSIENMRRYFQIVGSHNQKHLNRYYK